MQLSLAPMEGLTGYVFRKVHAECFGKLDRYYTPFLTPAHTGSAFGKRAKKELDPAFNQGLNVIPQLLSKDAQEFLWSTQLIADQGFAQVNLNLGCPSGTVTSRGRGSGFLGRLEELDSFLAEVFENTPIPVSIKTRIGMESDDEFAQILQIYRKYPLAELIIHPRLQKDQYKGKPRWRAYGQALDEMPFPVAYNGDIFTAANAQALQDEFPHTNHLMLGRGILTNPALAREIQGGASLTKTELKQFHDRLFTEYQAVMAGNAVFRMKEWWDYAQYAFEDSKSIHRAIRKLRRPEEYAAAVRKIFSTQKLSDDPHFKSM